MKKKVLITVLCLAIVSAIGITAFMNRSRGSDDINLIEPDTTKEPAEEAESFPGISVLNDPEWVIRRKDEGKMSEMTKCTVSNLLDNKDIPEDYSWAGTGYSLYDGLMDADGNIYYKTTEYFGKTTPGSDPRKSPDAIAYVRVLTDEQAEQILNSDELESLTEEQIFILTNMLVQYNRQTLVSFNYMSASELKASQEMIYFTSKRAIIVHAGGYATMGAFSGSSIPFILEVLPADAYILNHGIKENHIYRYYNTTIPDLRYISDDFLELVEKSPIAS